MSSINSSGQAIQEILLNNYLKEAILSEFRDFVATFWNFIQTVQGENLPTKKITYFLSFKWKYLWNRLR